MRRAALFLAFLAMVIFATPPIYAEDKPAEPGKEEVKDPVETPDGKGVTFNFTGWDMRKAVEYLSRILKKPIIYPDGFGGTINYVSYVPIAKEDILPLFETLLNLNNWQMVEVAGVIKIVPMTQGAPNSSGFYSDADRTNLRARDRVITQVFKLKYLTATDAIQTLSNFTISRNMVAIAQSNSIILTDYETIVLRIESILKEVDIAGPKIESETVKLQFAAVDTVKTFIEQYVSAIAAVPGGSTTAVNPNVPRQPNQPAGMGSANYLKPVAIPDIRTNSFILIGLREDIEEIKSFIAKIDVEGNTAGKYHVIKLQNIAAKDLSTPLNEAFAKAGVDKGSAEQPPVIIAYETQNALIVICSQSQFREIETLVERLDVPQMQVLIKTTIIEINTSKMRELGVELASGDFPSTDSYRGFASTFGTTNKFVVPGTSSTLPGGTGMTIGLMRDRNGIWAIPALLQAIQRDKDIDLLAEPQILAMDNEKASLTISEKIPYSTISNPTTTSGTSSTATYGGDYEASIKLIITPHIRSLDYLTLDIEQTVEQFFKSEFTFDVVSGSEANRPAKTVREAKTRVGVVNGGYVVIGGMTRTKTDDTISKIPFLGDIPGLGLLFRKSSRTIEKVNLYIFLQPTIIGKEDNPTAERDRKSLVDLSNEVKLSSEQFRRSRNNRDPLSKLVFKGMNEDNGDSKKDPAEKPEEPQTTPTPTPPPAPKERPALK